VNPTHETSLRARLISFICELDIDPALELTEHTVLLRSGLLDSAAMLQLAEWIQREVGAEVDLLQFDLSKEWDTIAGIEKFIQRHGHRPAE
jgi:acyl carrier protein